MSSKMLLLTNLHNPASQYFRTSPFTFTILHLFRRKRQTRAIAFHFYSHTSFNRFFHTGNPGAIKAPHQLWSLLSHVTLNWAASHPDWTYLGLLITSDLFWNKVIITVTARDKHMLGFLKRNCTKDLPPKSCEILIHSISYVAPRLLQPSLGTLVVHYQKHQTSRSSTA